MCAVGDIFLTIARCDGDLGEVNAAEPTDAVGLAMLWKRRMKEAVRWRSSDSAVRKSRISCLFQYLSNRVFGDGKKLLGD
jgi:hypothetical protein